MEKIKFRGETNNHYSEKNYATIKYQVNDIKAASRVSTLQLELVGRKSYAVALARKGSYISEIR